MQKRDTGKENGMKFKLDKNKEGCYEAGVYKRKPQSVAD